MELTRKNQRMQKKQQKKEKKRIFFSKRTRENPIELNKLNKCKDTVQERDENGWVDDVLDDDFCDAGFSSENQNVQPSKKPDKPKVRTSKRPDAEMIRANDLRRKIDLEAASRKRRIRSLKEENEEEDKTISRLEKKLKLNKVRNKNHALRKMFNDGLDYALEFCLNEDDENQELNVIKGNKNVVNSARWDSESIDFDEEHDVQIDETSQNEHNKYNSSNVDEDSKNGGNEDEDLAEDIYGRKRDKDGTFVLNDKYIPPHQRALLTLQNDDKHVQKMEILLKQCKGLLNRLSEANLYKIATGLEELYMKNSRNNMNDTLNKLLDEALISKTISKNRMVQEYMVVLAFLHAHIGSEIGAHFLQVFITSFDKLSHDIDNLELEDKRLNNLTLVLAYMFILKIYDHRLLLEIVNILTENLCEKSIECLLLLFKSVGFKLRKDDPLALKEIIIGIQTRIAKSPLELKENARLKYMVDILNAVKNNNIHKIPQFDPELVEHLRKTLNSMLRKDKYVITLNISYNDLLRAEQVGKWWVVGSAWSGTVNESVKKNTTNALPEKLYSEKLLTLSKEQKMNTEERRNIFCIIMSADDYVDAFEKIHHLALKDQRIVAYVVIQCCLNEKLSNPYYAYLAQKFCHFHRKFQLAFQFAIWDRLKEINILNKQQLRNFSNFLQHLFLKGALSILVLRVVDFLQLDRLSLYLMKETMLGLLLAENESDVFQTFECIAKKSKFKQFKNNIRLFIQHFLLQQEDKKLQLNEHKHALLKKRAHFVDNLLASMDL